MFVFKATFGRSLVSPDQMQQQRGPCGTVWQRRNYSVKMTRGTKMMMWKRWTDMHSNQMHTQSERSMGLATESWSCSCQKLQNSPLSMCAVNPSLLRNLMRNLVGQVPTKPRRVYQRPQLSPSECLAPPPPGSSLPFEKKSYALSYWNSDRHFFPNGNLNELCQLWDFFVLEGTPNWWRNLSIHGMMRYVFHSLLETLLLTIAHYGTAGASYLVKWM